MDQDIFVQLWKTMNDTEKVVPFMRNNEIYWGFSQSVPHEAPED